MAVATVVETEATVVATEAARVAEATVVVTLWLVVMEAEAAAMVGTEETASGLGWRPRRSGGLGHGGTQRVENVGTSEF